MPKYKFTLSKLIIHLRTIFIHKKWVFYYAKLCGIPFQGIIHDLSKFSPKELFINVKYVVIGKSPIDIQKQEIGYSFVWLHHKGHNPHHYEYWMDKFDDGCYITRMPLKYTIEMLCDYLAANKAYNGKDATFESQLAWWQIQRNIRKMHPDNILFLDKVFDKLKDYEVKNKNINEILNKKYLSYLYNYIISNSDYKIQVKI